MGGLVTDIDKLGSFFKLMGKQVLFLSGILTCKIIVRHVRHNVGACVRVCVHACVRAYMPPMFAGRPQNVIGDVVGTSCKHYVFAGYSPVSVKHPGLCTTSIFNDVFLT